MHLLCHHEAGISHSFIKPLRDWSSKPVETRGHKSSQVWSQTDKMVEIHFPFTRFTRSSGGLAWPEPGAGTATPDRDPVFCPSVLCIFVPRFPWSNGESTETMMLYSQQTLCLGCSHLLGLPGAPGLPPAARPGWRATYKAPGPSLLLAIRSQ